MRLRVTVEVLVLARAAIARGLPQLAQVGIDVAVRVASPGEAMRQRAAATDAFVGVQ